MKVKFKFRVYLPMVEALEPHNVCESVIEQGEEYEVLSYSVSLAKIILKRLTDNYKIVISRQDFIFACEEI